MKNTIIAVIALMPLFLTIPSAYSEDCTETYQNYLDQKISCYHNQSNRFANSRSVNLQQYAAVCQQKASYFGSVIGSIVEDLNKREGCLKPYQIDVYLNERFSSRVKSNSLVEK